MGRVIAFSYGGISYLFFLIAFLYAIGFVGNFAVPKSIDSGSTGPFGQSLVINILLLGLFAIQHSVMARPAFKKWWTRFVPESIERSTFVLLASLILLLLFWQWRPMTGIVWDFENAAVRFLLWALFWIGWAVVLVSTFMIGHFDLFGLKQVYFHLANKPIPAPRFGMPGFYRYVRHPIMLGFIIAFWATPTMTLGHLVFAVVTTIYILVAVKLFEERDLVGLFGDDYENYRKRVSMLIPLSAKK
ncbi:MAG TPA: isoprenylcysteine carboxylmethyltransferase family protein [Terriglobales bacterium]|nr:isoprenylcysteine carboxylmethyltransferase family protein [Terriglobales bacterium]